MSKKITNWREYNESLIKRGDITLWIDKDNIEKNWYSNKDKEKIKRGKKEYYSDICIGLMTKIKSLFKQSLRCTQGIVSSIFKLANINLKIPDYTTVCKRKGGIKIDLNSNLKGKKHLVIDSTGLKEYGEGEWKIKMHGESKKRRWLKLHFCVDENTKVLESIAVTSNNVSDHQVFKDLIESVNKDIQIEKISADGAYDKKEVFSICNDMKIEPIISIRKDAVLSNDKKLSYRNKIIEYIKNSSKKDWKIKHNYYRRSIAENFAYRFKTIFGDKVSSRKFDNQKTDLYACCSIINKFTSIGMPKFVIK